MKNLVSLKAYAALALTMIFSLVFTTSCSDYDGPETKINNTETVFYKIVNVHPEEDGRLHYDLENKSTQETTHHSVDMYPSLMIQDVDTIRGYQKGGIELTSSKKLGWINANEVYTFDLAKTKINAEANILLSHTVTHHGEDYQIFAKNAQINLISVDTISVSADSLTWKYRANVTLSVENVTVKTASVDFAEIVDPQGEPTPDPTPDPEPQPEDEVSYILDNIRPMADGFLYYDFSENHTVDTEKNSKNTFKFNMEPSLKGKAAGTKTVKSLGAKVNGAATQAYTGAKTYTWSCNGVENISFDASVILSKVVNHDKEYTVSAKNASLKLVSFTETNGNEKTRTYTATCELSVDGVKVATATTTRTQELEATPEPEPEPDPDPEYSTTYEFICMSRILSADEKSFHTGYIFKAEGKKNGIQVVIPTLGVDYFAPASEIKNSLSKVNSAVWNGKNFIPCEVLVDNAAKMFAYDGQNTTGDKYILMSFNEAVIKGIKNYSSDINISATPIVNGAEARIENGVMNIYLNGKLFHTYKLGE